MTNYLVNTIYPAYMGEVNVHGIGVPCTFLRLSGCNLRCYVKTKGCTCDTPEALGVKGKLMSIAEIILKLENIGRKVICLTGGEPLMQDVKDLLISLSDNGFYVVVETNGSKNISPYRHIRNVSFVVDVKSCSSGESEKMIEDNYLLMNKDDYLKFVIDTKEDFREFKNWMVAHNYINCNVAVGLFWGSEVSYEWLTKQLEQVRLPVYINMQTHKMSVLYDKTKKSKTFKDLSIPREI